MSYRHIIPTLLKDAQPGDETGDYHITFCNLPLNTTWQAMKDWISASCPVDYIEVFPTSCSGWIRLKGRDNFEKALAHLQRERFKDRFLLFDSRNETQAIKIRFTETSPKAKHARRRRSTRGNRGQEVPCEALMPHDRRTQNPPYARTWGQPDFVHAAGAVERRARKELLAFASLMFNTGLQSTLQMHYPVSVFPCYQAEYYNGMGMDYYGNAYSPYSFGGSPAFYPTQIGLGATLGREFDNVSGFSERWLDHRDW